MKDIDTLSVWYVYLFYFIAFSLIYSYKQIFLKNFLWMWIWYVNSYVFYSLLCIWMLSSLFTYKLCDPLSYITNGKRWEILRNISHPVCLAAWLAAFLASGSPRQFWSGKECVTWHFCYYYENSWLLISSIKIVSNCQGYKGIRQWFINWSTSPMMIPKTTLSLDKNYTQRFNKSPQSC